VAASEPLPPSGRTVIPVAHGGLEAILREPAAPIAAAVVCHPHPLHGGTMNNNVVYRTAKALVDAGVAALRFNFRGVGGSTGQLAYLRARHPTLPLWIAGFSFGARVGLAVGAEDAEVTKLFGIGLALTMFDHRRLAGCTKPKAFVQGSEDEYGGRAAIEAAVAAMPEPKRLWVVDGASHLYPGHLDAYEAAAREAVAWLVAQV